MDRQEESPVRGHQDECTNCGNLNEYRLLKADELVLHNWYEVICPKECAGCLVYFLRSGNIPTHVPGPTTAPMERNCDNCEHKGRCSLPKSPDNGICCMGFEPKDEKELSLTDEVPGTTGCKARTPVGYEMFLQPAMECEPLFSGEGFHKCPMPEWRGKWDYCCKWPSVEADKMAFRKYVLPEGKYLGLIA